MTMIDNTNNTWCFYLFTRVICMFQVSVTETAVIPTEPNAPLALSEVMFVHNNSKHGRRAKSRLDPTEGSELASIFLC